MSDKKLTRFEYIKIQMEAMVPYARFLQKEFGKKQARQLVEKYLEERISRAGTKNHSSVDLSEYCRYLDVFCKENRLEYNLVHQDDERLEFDITKCPFVEMMKDLNAQDLGCLLICSYDFIKAAEDGLVLKRTKTCMEGNDCCDFRYGKKK